MNKLFYRPIEGLRAVCFLIVFLFHCQLSNFELGWAGVSVFFVISGFLIGGILIDTKGNKDFLKIFYIRRILRIFPIYYLSLMFVICSYSIIYGGGGK
jgi:peptidoglycan/LPS O-acetylase OafA/YrhL